MAGKAAPPAAATAGGQLADRMVALFAAVFDQVPEPICIADLRGRVIRANQAFARACQERPDRLVGRPLLGLLTYVQGDSLVAGGRAGGDKRTSEGLAVLGRRTWLVRERLVPAGPNGHGLLVKLAPAEVAPAPAAGAGARPEPGPPGAVERGGNKARGDDDGDWGLQRIEGVSRAIRHAKGLAARAARSDLTVLLTGESGTGKELFARAVHHLSDRSAGRFVAINCSAVPGELFEAELFGYEPGAFTGAARTGKPGRFELASGGTLFLDEVADIPLPLQSKLLRALQEREVERVGGLRPVAVDVRVIAATNQDLEAMVARGRFRDDLYYRLAVITITLPPLRDRREDIPLIAVRLLEDLNRGPGAAAGLRKQFSPDALELLAEQPWPGNVRELENVVKRAYFLSDGLVMTAEALRPHLSGNGREAAEGVAVGGDLVESLPLDEVVRDAAVLSADLPVDDLTALLLEVRPQPATGEAGTRQPAGRDPLPDASAPLAPRALVAEVAAVLAEGGTLEDIVATVERHLIARIMEATGQNKAKTARILGLARSSFYEKLSRYGLTG